ncbi:hypothetical protein D3C84_1240290 [compost metagenome]
MFFREIFVHSHDQVYRGHGLCVARQVAEGEVDVALDRSWFEMPSPASDLRDECVAVQQCPAELVLI